MQVTPRIGGRPATAPEWIEVLSPYDGSPVARVPALGPDHVASAVAAAGAALSRDDFPQHRRAEVLERTADLLAERAEEFAVTIARESAHPIRTARAEATRAAATLRHAAAESRHLTGDLIPSSELVTPPPNHPGGGSGERLGFTLRRPAGVVAVVSPARFPLVAHVLGPAIAAGCPVVLKPSDRTPVSAIRLAELLVEAGLPDDWISVVTGPAAETPLVLHPAPAVLLFGGAAGEGPRVRQAAAGKRLLLSFEGPVPVIVGADADPGRVIDALQGDISLYVDQSLHDRLVAELQDTIAARRTGDPLDEATDAIPAVAVKPFARLTEAIRLANEANENGPGSQAAIFTSDLGAALRAARELRFAGVLVNEVPTFPLPVPMAALTDLKTVVVTP
ncbi:aldehyde dehydrogenase family protein [Paractinoplanes atraurantiacus]|uniref:Aldehyde dehydrogenase n=1 Tax=Paractinoplanes atraurantiacus TaxID=1036182 RepID=A0A285KRX5_9ACTN|nr:aldehyde dehydrogenase family protein [Actinoplanes atraurantiacus]SNY75380.1 aldehyde dehydrogenase [Actinoplanes atraurantiacus]